jgi:hypothetical protein
MGEKPDELDRPFIAPFDETDFLWTSELFVARQPLDRIPERPRGERSELHGVIALDALLGPELQTKRRIVAGFRYSTVQSEKFLGADEDSLQLEQGSWQTRLAQDCVGRKAQFFELPRQRTRNAKSITHSLRDSITVVSRSFAPPLLFVLMVADVLHPIQDPLFHQICSVGFQLDYVCIRCASDDSMLVSTYGYRFLFAGCIHVQRSTFDDPRVNS